MNPNGQDLYDMDSADQVMVEIRKALAEESNVTEETATVGGSGNATYARNNEVQEAPQKAIMRQNMEGELNEQRADKESDTGEYLAQGDRIQSGRAQRGADGRLPDRQSIESDENSARSNAGNVTDGSVADGPERLSDNTGDATTSRNDAGPQNNFVIDNDGPLGEGTDGQSLKPILRPCVL